MRGAADEDPEEAEYNDPFSDFPKHRFTETILTSKKWTSKSPSKSQKSGRASRSCMAE